MKILPKPDFFKNTQNEKEVYSTINNGCGDVYIKGTPIKIYPENIPLDIVYEDKNMLVVNKPSGMLTHPNIDNMSGSMVNALLDRYGSKGLSNNRGEFCRGIVHRLDKDTSGLVMVAKNNKTEEYLMRQINNHTVTKKYLAVVKGVIKEDEFTINKPIGKDKTQKFKMAIDERGKPSTSIVKVLKRFSDATLVEVQIVTGRTHQIRVHMASIGHPVYGDTMYGGGDVPIKTQGQALQSYKLTFHKPFEGTPVSLEIPMDAKLTKVVKYYSNSSKW